ncbi:hypothetical protein ACODNH_01650 (plasmid) [Haloarcula sp. NS06]|uniref:hypothetical protein n=1 Tax=Haloarcula sp. NS06 TaxID=3409688 RepID=UPI003DA71CC0
MSGPIHGESDTLCLVCGENEFSAPFDEVEAVCDICGFVVYDWRDSSTDELMTAQAGTESVQTESWSDIRPAHNSTQHRFSDAIEVIEKVSNALVVTSSVRLTAAELYVEAAVSGISEGRSIDTVAAGSLHIAAKDAGGPRTLKRIANVAHVKQTTLKKTVRRLYDEFAHGNLVKRTIAAPEEYLEFLCLDLCLDSDAPADAATLLQEIGEHSELQGKHPAGVAAAAVYLTMDSPPPQRKLAASAGVATETLRKRLNEFRELLEEFEDG